MNSTRPFRVVHAVVYVGVALLPCRVALGQLPADLLAKLPPGNRAILDAIVKHSKSGQKNQKLSEVFKSLDNDGGWKMLEDGSNWQPYFDPIVSHTLTNAERVGLEKNRYFLLRLKLPSASQVTANYRAPLPGDAVVIQGSAKRRVLVWYGNKSFPPVEKKMKDKKDAWKTSFFYFPFCLTGPHPAVKMQYNSYPPRLNRTLLPIWIEGLSTDKSKEIDLNKLKMEGSFVSVPLPETYGRYYWPLATWKNGNPKIEVLRFKAAGQLAFEGKRGDVVQLDIKSRLGSGAKEFKVVDDVHGGKLAYVKGTSTQGENARQKLSIEKFQQDGILYVVPTINSINGAEEASGPTSLTCRVEFQNAAGQTKQEPVTVTIEEGYSKLDNGLMNRVGATWGARSGTEYDCTSTVNENLPLNIYRVQQRLRFLNFRAAKQSQTAQNPEIVADGQWGRKTAEALALFNAVIGGKSDAIPIGNVKYGGYNRPGVQPAIDAETLKWLNAPNAPRWWNLSTYYTNGNLNNEYWATNWTHNVIQEAIKISNDNAWNCIKATHITSLTEFPDTEKRGTSLWTNPNPPPDLSAPHETHHNGLAIDWGLKSAMPGITGITNDQMSSSTTTTDLLTETQRQQIRRTIIALHRAAEEKKVGISNTYIGGKGANQSTYPTLKTVVDGEKTITTTNSKGHHNHLHVNLTPPERED